MLAWVVAAVGFARGLTLDETVTLAQVAQSICTKRGLDPNALTIRQAYNILTYATEAVIEQSRGSATGTPADPTNPPTIG